MTHSTQTQQINQPSDVKMTKNNFKNLCRRYGYVVINTQFGMTAKKRGCWIYSDTSWVNSEKVTNFQAFYKDTEGSIKEKNLTYVWQLKNFLRSQEVMA